MPEDKDPLSDLIEYATKHASSSPDIAEDVLAFFCDAVEGNSVPDARVLEYLADRFRLVLDGENADKALGLAGKRGKRKRRTHERLDARNLKLARAVARLRDEGVFEKDAYKQVAATLHESKETVKRAYRAFREIAHV